MERSKMTSALFGEISTQPWRPGFEEEVLDYLLGAWATYRVTSAGGNQVRVPDGIFDRWDHDELFIFQTLAGSPQHTHVTTDRIIREAEADYGLEFHDIFRSYWGLGQLALEALVQASPNLTANDHQRLYQMALRHEGGEDEPPYVNEIVTQSWFPWDETVKASFAARWEPGLLYLQSVRETTDKEAWDALIATWQGTVGELVEACTLTNR